MVHRSSPAKTSNKTKPRYRIPAMSKARYARMKEYGKLRKEFLASKPLCEYPGCRNKPQDIHHLRGRIGRMLCASQYFVAVCRQHHHFIHENPDAARADGMICEKGLWGKL